MKRTKKVEIWMNGRFFEIAKNIEQAQQIIDKNKRHDEYERSIGYFVPAIAYEIRTYSGQH